MDKRYVIWLAPGVVAFALAFAGCQKNEEPVPAATLHRRPRLRVTRLQGLALSRQGRLEAM